VRIIMGERDADREERALTRWKPGVRWYYPAISFAVIRLSRFIMSRMNQLEIEGGERFDALQERGGRGLLTFSNHVSMFDDPLLPCNLGLPKYSEVRWVAADALNFYGSAWKAWIFTAGKAVPIVREPGCTNPAAVLAAASERGDWVHIFPEEAHTEAGGPDGGRTEERDRMLMAEALPIALPFTTTDAMCARRLAAAASG
jgi:1-acyl-sn-glycerol-3-phosphate acyltransferase